MYFLCPNHRNELTRLPQSQLSDYWLNWMLEAGNHYEEENWNAAIPFAGCSLDLTSSALQRKDVNHVDLATEAALSTIYATNMLAHQRQFERASQIADIVSQRIMVMMLNTENHSWAETCLEAINNPNRQYEFFTEYMSLPFQDSHTLRSFCA
ncbi:MAG: hypothetical protein CSA49_06580 [Gammaproteobacteria bacterium]|nr:MAG: hypothetical protein CSA49_06580 [Gammaproteobacteria bacterium]